MNKSRRSVLILLLGILLDFTLLGQVNVEPLNFMDLKYSSSVEVRSRSGSSNLSGEEAKRHVKAFLKKVTPQKVKTLHEGYSKDKSSFYGILQLVSSSGNHRLFYYCQNVEGQYLITKVRIHER